MIPFDAVIVIAPSMAFVRLESSRAMLLGDREHRVIVGRAAVTVAGLVDGHRTKQEVILRAAEELGDVAALSALWQLEAAGHIVHAPPTLPTAVAAFWHAHPVPLPDSSRRLES